jgi:hypothetical protein
MTLELLNELRRFVNRLYEFVPVTSGVESTLHFNPPLEPVDTSVPEQSPQQLGILETPAFPNLRSSRTAAFRGNYLSPQASAPVISQAGNTTI